MAETKRIGVLTSGGDCAGLNAIIRAVVYRAVHTYGWEVIGIREGTLGLMSAPPHSMRLTLDMFTGLHLREGGTLIGTTSRGDPFAFETPEGQVIDRSDETIAGFKALDLEALIAIGGDGSFRILSRLAHKGGFPMIGIPKTIDNDVPETENSIGFITAVNVATEALDRLQTTAASHSRIMILEVMGRDAGHIALSAGVAGGADIILIPEIPYTMEALVKRIHEVRNKFGRGFALVVVAEGCPTEDGSPVTVADDKGRQRYGGVGHYLSHRLGEATGYETRVTVLGHVQRGGVPSTTDRVLGSAFGVRAVDLVNEGRFNRMVVWQNRQVRDVAFEDVVGQPNCVDIEGDLVRTARGLGISFGDR